MCVYIYIYIHINIYICYTLLCLRLWNPRAPRELIRASSPLREHATGRLIFVCVVFVVVIVAYTVVSLLSLVVFLSLSESATGRWTGKGKGVWETENDHVMRCVSCLFIVVIV